MKKHIKFFLVFCGVILCLAACDSDDANEERIESIEREIKELKDEQQGNSSKEEEATANYKELEVEEPIFIPSGSMSDSIFDLQNMISISVEEFGMGYDYKYMPIDVSVPHGPSAFIEGALFVPFGNNYVFTFDIHENERPDDIIDMVKERVTPIINGKADSEKTVISCLSQETGFINGCEGYCYTYEIEVDGENNPYYASVFELYVYENYMLGDHEIIIGCMGMGRDASFMQERYDVATAMVRTLHFNSKRRDMMFN